MSYLEIGGLVFYILLAIVILIIACFVVFIPAIEAVSLCRWYSHLAKTYPQLRKDSSWIFLWWSCFYLGGREFSSKSCEFGSWNGIGNWFVYVEENEGNKD